MHPTYRAMSFSRYGGPEVLQAVELASGEIAAAQVGIRVRAASVNPLECKIRSGLLADTMPTELPMVPGVDVAGVVIAAGEGVTGFALGDEVFGKATSGSYAERVVADPHRLAAKPGSLSWEIAAALPVAATTAWHALDLLGLRAGETLVIDGAAGAVGSVAVQLARRRGAKVIGTCSVPNRDWLRQLGATPVPYGDGLPERMKALAPGAIDAALDASGQGAVDTLINLVRSPERVVSLADPRATELGARFLYGEPDDMASILAEVGALAAAGEITVRIAGVYPLSRAADAHRDIDRRSVSGKLILVPDATHAPQTP